jgi:hypothetical protein
MQNASKSPMIFSFGRGMSICPFYFGCVWWGGVSVFSFLFWVMGGFLCHDTLLFLSQVQGGCKDPKVVIFFSLKHDFHS